MEERIKKKPFKSKKSMMKTIWTGYSLGGLSLVVGLLWLHDYKTQGYYYMGKEGMYISGNEAIVSLFGIITFSTLMVIYTVYLTIRGIIQIRRGELKDEKAD